jgi:hypothetical protein
MPIPIMQVAQGVGTIASTWAGRKDRQAEYAASEAEYNRTKADYMNLDTSNPYANMENTYEDLTVNTQQADYTSQQQQQALSNTMGNLQGAAGGSGIASLAQAMAGQQSQNLQQASASIGQQEQANQRAAATGAANIQSMERQGENLSRGMERDSASTLLGMGQARFGAAKDAKAQATQAYAQGFGQVAGGVMGQIGAAGTTEVGDQAGWISSNPRLAAWFGTKYTG